MTNQQRFAKDLLSRAGLFYGSGEEPDDDGDQILNMNDTWGWATAYGEHVPDEDLPEVARLFVAYGFCGVLYWVSKKNDDMESEFSHINRFVQFVREEEKLREGLTSSQHAYKKSEYTISG
jgi:hypothetical protein